MEQQKSLEIPELVPEVIEPAKLDLNNLNPWLDERVKRPFKGFGDKTNPDGTKFSVNQQIEVSKEQLRMTVRDWKALNFPDEIIKEQLILTVRGLSVPLSKSNH